MSLPRLFVFLLFLLPFAAPAQNTAVGKQPRILLLLDGSSSMLQPWQEKGETRFTAAARIIDALMDSVYKVNNNVEFSLRVYGHQHGVPENNCFDTRREVIFSKNNRAQMELRLASLQPLGVSPIAYSLRQAAENDLEAEDRYSYSIILITDGGESCGGDLCAVAKELAARNIFFKPYILSLVDYAPLAQQYACLGQYLTVANTPAVKQAIGTIVDSYKPALTGIPAPKPAAPVAAGPVVVPPARDLSTLARLTPARIRRNTLPQFVLSLPRARPVPRFPLPQAIPDNDELPRLVYVLRTKPAPQPGTPVVKRQRPLAIPRFPLPPVIEDARQPEAALRTLSLRPARQLPQLRSVPGATVRTRTIPRFPLPQPERDPVVPEPPLPRLDLVERWFVYRPMLPPQVSARPRSIPRFQLPTREADPAPVVVATPVPAPKSAPAPKPAPKPSQSTAVITRTVELPGVKNADYVAETEPAKEASVQIYFTDGRGKFYSTTPQMQLLDPKTGAVVKKFYRMIDAAGNPQSEPVPPGTYNILVAGRSNLMASRVAIGANEKKKVTIMVSNGSLKFVYSPNAKRPVSEFTATVVRRFADASGSTVQKCTEERAYEPGNYYVEVNTLPVLRRNFDMDFEGITQIDIPEPGWVQFTDAAPIAGKVVLFQPIGDGYAAFFRMDVTGAAADQKLRLQPGTYEARWVRNAGSPQPEAATKRFVVKSNATAEVQLQ